MERMEMVSVNDDACLKHDRSQIRKKIKEKKMLLDWDVDVNNATFFQLSPNYFKPVRGAQKKTTTETGPVK